jgi:hypothetical protein
MAQYDRDYSSSRDGEWNIMYIIVGAIALLLLVGLVVGWFATDQNQGIVGQDTTTGENGMFDGTFGMDTQQPQQPGQQPATGVGGGDVAIADINDNPQEFVGNAVFVTGTLANYESDNAFTVREGVLRREILVVHSPSTLGQAMEQIDENQRVEVQGTVHMFDREALEQELGIEMYEGVYENRDENQPVIVASQIRQAQQ